MTIENTNTAAQQPNPVAAAGAATPAEAANPQAGQGIDPVQAPGQGDGGDAGNAGKQGAGEGEGTGSTGDGQNGEGQPDALTGAPEAYADPVLPEGFVLEGDRKEAALSLFRDLNLSQAGAQRAVDQFIKLVGDDEAMRNQAAEAAVAQQREEWSSQAKAELGERYDAEVAFARTAVQAVQSPALVEAFDKFGWGNHPELIKAFAMFGRSMRDSSVEGIGDAGGEAAKKQNPWDAMYAPTK